MNNKFSVSVVIPSYNGEKILRKNLPKLIKEKNNPKNKIVEIIIVNDGSKDQTSKFIKSNYKEIRLLENDTNRGFSHSVNKGVKIAKGNLILLINIDVIPKKDFLENVFKHFGNPKVFAVSLHEKGYGWGKGYFSNGYIQLGMGKESDKAHESFYVSAGSGVFRKKIYNELGGMDEKLLSPFYWEDVDLCYRALKRGYVNLWEPKSSVLHEHESTISSEFQKIKVQRIKERNQLLIVWKNVNSKELIYRHIVAIVARAVRHPGYFRIIFMALKRLGIALESRKRENEQKLISDKIILSKFT